MGNNMKWSLLSIEQLIHRAAMEEFHIHYLKQEAYLTSNEIVPNQKPTVNT